MKKVKNLIIFSLGFVLFFFLVGIQLFNVRAFVVASDSMAPVIRKHALVYAKKVNKENVDIGDVIVIKTGKTPVLHRVIEINETTVTTNGDNNDNPDKPVNWEFVQGKMIYQIPLLGIFIMSVYPWIILALFVAIYYVTKRLIKELRKN